MFHITVTIVFQVGMSGGLTASTGTSGCSLNVLSHIMVFQAGMSGGHTAPTGTAHVYRSNSFTLIRGDISSIN